MAKQIDLQTQYLSGIKEEGKIVKVYMLNGFQMSGKILQVDAYTILIDIQGKHNLLYKHAISTIEIPK